MSTATAERRSEAAQPMRTTYAGKTYKLVFKHRDYRFRTVFDTETGEIIGREPADRRLLRRKGQARTVCYIFEVTGKTEEGHDSLLGPIAVGEVKCSPKDHFNRAHGRWYALERALLEVEDKGLRRALRKAYYAGTSWRPDGRDGFKIDHSITQCPQLTRVW